jgi:hypothetical protein
MVNRKPNLFIVGTRKTGTTSLYHYLKDHPEVFMSAAKEPHFFSKNLNYHIHLYHNEKEYMSLFKEVTTEKIIGEASTSYLDNENIPSLISNFQPDSKIIIILRDPVELIYSMHFEFAFRGRVVKDFKEELEIQKNGDSIINYIDLIKNIPSVINRYIEVFGNEQVYIMNYENFKKDNQTEFIKILRFLEVSEKFIPEFKKYNTSSKPKSFLIARLLNLEIIRLIGETVHRLIPGTNNYDPFSWNSQPFERTEMPDDLRSLLEEELKDTRIKFQSLLQKD